MIKALIFDFDGLILDTETAWYEAYKKVLWEEYQFDLPLEKFVQAVGSSNGVLVTYLNQAIGTVLNLEEVQAQTSVLHTEAVKNLDARPGVVDYLKGAKEKNLAIALATSSSRNWVEHHLGQLQLLPYFDHLITRDDVEQVKPAPDLFLKAIETLNVAPEEAVVFEDSLNGLIAAREVGIPTVIIPNPVTASLPFEIHQLKMSSMEEMTLADVINSMSKL